MDYESDHHKIQKVGSISQTEKEFFPSSKFLTRQTTVESSCSSRFFYGPSEGVPFQWESQPGKSMTPPQESTLPPLSPPPAVLAMGLPRPYIEVDEPKPKKWTRAWLAKKVTTTNTRVTNRAKILLGGSKNIFNLNKPQQHHHHHRQREQNFESQRYERSESFRSSSSSVASTLTSSSSNSFIDNKTSSNVDNTQSKVALRGKPFTCNPRGFSDILVHFVKRAS